MIDDRLAFCPLATVSLQLARALRVVSARLRDKALHWFAAAEHLALPPGPSAVERAARAGCPLRPRQPLGVPNCTVQSPPRLESDGPQTQQFQQPTLLPRRRCGALSQGWDARSGGPPAPAPALLATHSLRPCRSVSSASSTTLHGPTFGRDFSTRPRLVPSSDAAVARSAMVPYPARTEPVVRRASAVG